MRENNVGILNNLVYCGIKYGYIRSYVKFPYDKRVISPGWEVVKRKKKADNQGATHVLNCE